jgi:hypothetical protein
MDMPMQSAENSDSDDSCFFELDVFINPAENTKGLHLFQYPLRPKDRPYSDGGNNFSSATICVHKQDTAPKHVIQESNDHSKNEIPKPDKTDFRLTFNLKTETKEKGKVSNYDSNAVDHRITSFSVESESVPHQSGIGPNYFIGSLESKGLILSKIENFDQFRPSFQHVNEEKMQRTIKQNLKTGFGQQADQKEAKTKQWSTI